MPNRSFLLKVISAILIVSALGFLFLLDARNSSRGAGVMLGQQYSDHGAGDYENPLGPPRQYGTSTDLTGSLAGNIVDDSDAAIAGIEVELIPLDKVGDQRWYATKHDWTNAKGQYGFPKVEPGEYVVAMQMRGAPDVRHPFAGTYYPGADAEPDADRIYVVTGTALDLHPVRLRRLETVTVQVNVEFEDGSRPKRSNLLFHNLSFPQQAVIGDEAPEIENGKGDFTLPVGFNYYGSAKVDCDGRATIESRESRPIQRLHVESGSLPDELTFIIPGPPCALWSPK